MGCDDWNSALNSFHLCLTIPCRAVSAISVAARKKSLLCRCLLLEAEELDGRGNMDVPTRSIKSQKAIMENKVLDLPGTVSPVVSRYMTSPAYRVGDGGGEGARPGGDGGSARERTLAGESETSEQPPHGRGSASRRRYRSNASTASSGEAGEEVPSSDQQRSKNYSQLGRYHDLVSTYISGNANHYATLLAEMSSLLSADGNWGLAKRLEGRLVYRAVRQVASVYSVVGVAALENRMQEALASFGSTCGEIGTQRVEDIMMGMVASDWNDPLVSDPFVVKIDQLTGMVSFQSDEESGYDNDDDEKWLEYDLSQRLESCISLAERVRDLDISLATSTKYQQHMMKKMMMKSDASMKQGQGVVDIGRGSCNIGMDWS